MLPYTAGADGRRLFCEVTSWVMGFGRHAQVVEPHHLRQAVSEELAATADKYLVPIRPTYQEDSERRTFWDSGRLTVPDFLPQCVISTPGSVKRDKEKSTCSH
jgi:hypothetical protein